MKTKIIKKRTYSSKISPLEISKNQAELISVVLLCDSPGYRMKSYGPLSLINIHNTKLIDIQIQAIKEVFTNFELILCLGFDCEKVCKYVRSRYPKLNIRIVENQLYHSSNSCESLRISLNNISNNQVLICDGNLMLNPKALKLINISQTCALIEENPCHTMEVGLNTDESNNVKHLSFGAKKIWSEILFLHNKDNIENLRNIIVNYDSKTRFVFEAINELINSETNIIGIKNKHQIMKINNIKTYHSMKDKK